MHISPHTSTRWLSSSTSYLSSLQPTPLTVLWLRQTMFWHLPSTFNDKPDPGIISSPHNLKDNIVHTLWMKFRFLNTSSIFSGIRQNQNIQPMLLTNFSQPFLICIMLVCTLCSKILQNNVLLRLEFFKLPPPRSSCLHKMYLSHLHNDLWPLRQNFDFLAFGRWRQRHFLFCPRKFKCGLVPKMKPQSAQCPSLAFRLLHIPN